jgi:energy-coupling factor transport system substrate-specific component
MVTLVALSSAMYAAGIVALRTPPPLSTIFVGQLILMPMSMVFGPAGAWGAVFGSIISEIVTGNLQVGSFVGCFGNLVLGSFPYVLWTRLRPLAQGTRELRFRGIRWWLLFFLIAVSSSFAAAIVIAWPMDMLGIVPFKFLLLLIGVQDAIVRTIAQPVVALVYRRTEALGLVWWEIMDETEMDRPGKAWGVCGAWLAVGAAVVFFIAGAFSAQNTTLIGGGGTALIIVAMIMMW